MPFHEDDLWNGYPEETNAPYGVAKKAILVGAQAYREQYGTNAIFLLPVEPLRAGRQLRPRDLARHPRADPEDGRGAASADDEIVLWGDGTPTREFLYVDDCVDGLVLAAERYDGAEPVNLGTGEEIAIRDLAELVRAETGFAGEIRWDTSKPNGQPRRKLDTTRAGSCSGSPRRCRCARASRGRSPGTAQHAVA